MDAFIYGSLGFAFLSIFSLCREIEKLKERCRFLEDKLYDSGNFDPKNPQDMGRFMKSRGLE